MTSDGGEDERGRLSRRRVLGQLGAGLGLVWVVPTVATLPAAAETSPPFPPVLPMVDEFARPDASGALSFAPTGQVWRNDLGTWGTLGGRAVQTSATYGITTTDTVFDDPAQAYGTIVVDVATVSPGFHVVFRFAAIDSYWRFGSVAGGVYRLRSVRPFGSVPGTGDYGAHLADLTPQDGDRIIIRLLVDDSIDVSVQRPGDLLPTFVVGTGDCFDIGLGRIGFAADGSGADSPSIERIAFYPWPTTPPEVPDSGLPVVGTILPNPACTYPPPP